MKTNHGAELSKYALDATLPLLRPDSYVTALTSGLFGLWTPSCWGIAEQYNPDGVDNWVLAFSPQESNLIAELKSVGEVEEREIGWTIVGSILDEQWWIHRAEDGMIPAEILKDKIREEQYEDLLKQLSWRVK